MNPTNKATAEESLVTAPAVVADPIRAALERLVSLSNALDIAHEWEPWTNALAAARAALADAPPAEGGVVGPSDEDLLRLMPERWTAPVHAAAAIQADALSYARVVWAAAAAAHQPAPVSMVLTSSPEVLDALEALPPGRIEPLPPSYIDPELQGEDLELLQTFYAACRAEGGTADEIHLRGLSAVLAARPAAPLEGESPAESLAARPLLEKVARLGDVIGQQTVAQVQQLAEQAAAWLQENPPGQPVAIEPRGCPMPGACSCVEPAAASDSIGRLCDALAQAVRPDSGYRALTSDDLKSGEEITGGAGEQIVGVEWWLPQLGCDSLQQTLDSIKGRIIFAVRDWWKTAFVTTTLVDFPAETIKPPDPEVARPAAARCGGAAMSDTNRTPLSPAAQAVLDTAHEAWVTRDDPGSIAAAALRAAAHETDAPLSITHIPEQQQRWYGLGVANLKRKLFAIAAELEWRP